MIKVELTQSLAPAAFPESQYEKLVRGICTEFGVAEATVSLAILDDVEMTRLNRKYKQRVGTTDCFSFDLSEDSNPGTPRFFEILVNGEKAQREAQARGHGVQAELALYITHGLLHNLGFSDGTAIQAKEMHAREDEILARFGYGVVYNRAEKES